MKRETSKYQTTCDLIIIISWNWFPNSKGYNLQRKVSWPFIAKHLADKHLASTSTKTIAIVAAHPRFTDPFERSVK